jgi:hypothetical protein
MYKIINCRSLYTLFVSDDLARTKQVFYRCDKRVKSELLLVNTATGEVLKVKGRKKSKRWSSEF